MPELPPVKVKVNVDTSQLREAEVQMEMFGKTVGHSTDSASASVKKMGDDIDREAKKASKGLKDVGDQSDKSSTQLLDLGRAGVQPANALIGLGVALGVLMTPLLAYTAGLAAALALGAVVVGGLAALGVGVIALADHYGKWAEAAKTLTTAQANLVTATKAHDAAIVSLDKAQNNYNKSASPNNLLTLHAAQQKATESANQLAAAHTALTAAQQNATNPLTTLTNHLDAMAKVLGQQAVPAATSLLHWLDFLIPTVQRLGSELITWFSERIPTVIPFATELFQIFTDAIVDLGKKVGPIFDEVLAHPQAVEAAFKKAMGGAVDAVVWILTKLGELTKWWDQNGPQLEKDASQTMGTITNTMIFVVQAIGQLSLAMNQIEQASQPAWQSITEGIRTAQPMLDKAVEIFHALDPIVQTTGKHADALKPIFQAVGILLSFMATSAVLTMVSLELLAWAIIILVGWLSAAVDWIRRVGDAGGLAGIAMSKFGGAVHALMDDLSRLLGWLGRVASALNNLPHASIGISWPTGRASGGPVIPGGVYTVGEHGPETLIMGERGGMVVADGGGQSSGGRSVIINVIGSGMSSDQVAMAISRRMSAATGR